MGVIRGGVVGNRIIPHIGWDCEACPQCIIILPQCPWDSLGEPMRHSASTSLGNLMYGSLWGGILPQYLWKPMARHSASISLGTPLGAYGEAWEYWGVWGVLGSIGGCQVEANKAAQQSTLHVLEMISLKASKKRTGAPLKKAPREDRNLSKKPSQRIGIPFQNAFKDRPKIALR